MLTKANPFLIWQERRSPLDRGDGVCRDELSAQRGVWPTRVRGGCSQVAARERGGLLLFSRLETIGVAMSDAIASAKGKGNHPWKFLRVVGFDQVKLDSGADPVALEQLDQKL